MRILVAEDISKYERLGFHCSNKPDLKIFQGSLEENYIQRFFRAIIDLYKANEDKYNELLAGLEENNEFFEEENEPENILDIATDYDSNHVSDEHAALYAPYFEQTGLNHIFTFNKHAEKRYGDYCYEVYINNSNYQHDHDDNEILADVFFFFSDKSQLILKQKNTV
jgi:hypothetical protein